MNALMRQGFQRRCMTYACDLVEIVGRTITCTDVRTANANCLTTTGQP